MPQWYLKRRTNHSTLLYEDKTITLYLLFKRPELFIDFIFASDNIWHDFNFGNISFREMDKSVCEIWICTICGLFVCVADNFLLKMKNSFVLFTLQSLSSFVICTMDRKEKYLHFEITCWMLLWGGRYRSGCKPSASKVKTF